MNDLSKPLKRIGIFTILVSLILIITISTFTYTLSNRYCLGLCHAHKESNRAWKKSTHNKVYCISCHIKPGVTNLVFNHTVSVFRWGIGVMFNSYEKPLNKDSHLADEIWNESCEACHSLKKVTPSPTYKINHKIHLKKKIRCTTCHNRIGHPGVEGYKDFMKMEACFRCHGQEKEAKAPGGCGACHTDYPKPDSHLEATFFPKGHAKMAKSDRDLCAMCHLSKFCRDCHGMDVPHTDPFKSKEHGKLVREKGFTLCQKCHDNRQNFCDAGCHHKGWKPEKGPWWSPTPGLSQHPSIVEKTGADKCRQCHGITYCTYCHVRGKKAESIKGPEE